MGLSEDREHVGSWDVWTWTKRLLRHFGHTMEVGGCAYQRESYKKRGESWGLLFVFRTQCRSFFVHLPPKHTLSSCEPLTKAI